MFPPHIKRALQKFINYIDQLEKAGKLTDEIKSQATEEVKAVVEKYKATAEIPKGAEVLWMLAGEDPNTFVKYLSEVPDKDLQELKTNPERLNNVIETLYKRITPEVPASPEGFLPSATQSSNIFGFKYDPKNKKLIVKFQGNRGRGEGPVYEYSDVPAFMFKLFKDGAISAKTSGSNKWGMWWKHKNPSVGASHYALIRDSFPYQRVA